MKFSLNRTDSISQLENKHWNVGIIGLSLDDRCDVAIQYARNNCDTLITLTYNSDEFSLELNGVEILVDDQTKLATLLKFDKILLESTSLGFVELLMATRAIHQNKSICFDYLYLEPGGYKKIQKNTILQRRDFELSNEVPGYKSIPGFSYMLSDESSQKIVFFLGYEAARLDRAFEDYQMIRSDFSSVIFGVPAFKCGWEMDSFANMVSIIKDRRISGGTYFCSASNPLAAYMKLEDIYNSLDYGQQLFISPIGTTPEGIGAILFALERPGIGILYDHPIKQSKRTGAVASCHLYTVEL